MGDWSRGRCSLRLQDSRYLAVLLTPLEWGLVREDGMSRHAT